MSWDIALIIEDSIDGSGWHARQLQQALVARGCRVRSLALPDCALDLDGGAARVHLPGYPETLPDGVFVRGIAGGSLEEVVFRLDVLHALEACGVTVYNDARAIERSVDKGLTSYLLAAAGLPTPPTCVTSAQDRAEAFVQREWAAGHHVVCKPLFGSQGKGLLRLAPEDALPAREAVHGVWYLQRFLPSVQAGSADWRLFVVGGQVIAAMRRSSTQWLTNVARGGDCHPAVLEPRIQGLAVAAVARLGMAYAGVDLLRDLDGRWWVLEVNSIPAWRGLQAVTPVDVAGRLADDLIRCCATRTLREVGA